MIKIKLEDVIKKIENNKEFYLKIAKFVDEMIKIQEEKQPKYKDTWKTAELSFLRNKLRGQLDKTILSDKKHKEYTMRKLLHVANYAFLLYNRLGEK